MKIDHSKIKELQSSIDHWLDGIKDAVMCGGDIRDNVCDQIDEIRKIMNQWNALNMMPAEKEIIPDYKYDYLKLADRALDKKPEDLHESDNRYIWMAKVYAYIKRTMRERNDLPGPDADRHAIFCYIDDILTSMPLFHEYEKHYSNSMIRVADDITTEIETQRAKNPQLDIFTIQSTNNNGSQKRKAGNRKKGHN